MCGLQLPKISGPPQSSYELKPYDPNLDAIKLAKETGSLKGMWENGQNKRYNDAVIANRTAKYDFTTRPKGFAHAQRTPSSDGKSGELFIPNGPKRPHEIVKVGTLTYQDSSGKTHSGTTFKTERKAGSSQHGDRQPERHKRAKYNRGGDTDTTSVNKKRNRGKGGTVLTSSKGTLGKAATSNKTLLGG